MKLQRHVSRLAAVTLLITAIVGIFPVDAGVAQTPTQGADPFTVALGLKDIFFDPEVLEVPADQDVIIRLENTGAALHGFEVEALGISVEVSPGESLEVTINAPVGEYPFICTSPGHKDAGMRGTLRVVRSQDLDPNGNPTPFEAAESNSAGLSAQDFLPELQDLEGNWTVEQEGERSETEFAEALGEEGEVLLRAWGWQENAYRDFARENPEQFSNEATYLSVSIHGFADSEGAASALPFLSQQVVDAQNLEEIPANDLGDNARVLSGPGDGVNLAVVYVQAGNFLIRVGASSEAGDPSEMAIDVAEVSLAKAESASQISPVVTGTPVASPAAVLDDPGCEGLPGYSKLVLEIETDAWNRLVAEFGVDDQSDIRLLEEEQFADLAMMLDSEAAVLIQVEAPGFAEDWHQVMIALVHLEATIARMVPEFGNPFAAHVQLWEVSEVLDDQYRQAYLDIVADCPIFETLWTELNLIDGDAGTPPEAAPDYSSCAGLERYGSNLERAEIQALAIRPDLAEAYLALGDLDEEALHARSPVELITLSMLFEELGDQVAGVTPPEYALEWHLTQGFWYDVASSYWLAAAGSGFESADEEFGMQFGLVGLLEEGAIEKATEECSVFADFVVG